MTLQSKILLVNICLAVAVVTAAAFATDTFPGNGFFLMLSVITSAGGVGSLGLGLLLLFRKDKSAARAYLITAALLIVIGLCSFFFLQKY